MSQAPGTPIAIDVVNDASALKDRLRSFVTQYNDLLKFATDQGVVYIDGNANPPTVSNDDKAADCTLKMDFGDFADLIGGKLDGMTAFMTGKLKIEGDMGIAMQLGTILS